MPDLRYSEGSESASDEGVRSGERSGASAFSLVEVVIAVGIFATSVTVILALLPALARQAAVSTDTLTAQRLPDALRVELQRVAATGGFDALANQTAAMTAPLPSTLTLVASRDGTRVHTLSYQSPPAAEQLAEPDQYFLIETWSFSAAPLVFDPDAAWLALHVRVSWPYRTPGFAVPTPPASREAVTFNLSLSR